MTELHVQHLAGVGGGNTLRCCMCFFSSLEVRVIQKDITNHARVDLTVMVAGHIYVMEIKVVEGDRMEENPALASILQRWYADKYIGVPGKVVHELGLVFCRVTQNLI